MKVRENQYTRTPLTIMMVAGFISTCVGILFIASMILCGVGIFFAHLDSLSFGDILMSTGFTSIGSGCAIGLVADNKRISKGGRS